jgi:hypothetical protein
MKTKRARLRVQVDPRRFSMLAAIRTAASGVPLLVVTGRALADLAEELGGYDPAVRELLAIAESVGRPIGVNVATGRDTSRTAFIAPQSWSEERLHGWIAGHHAELEDAFGGVARVGRI